MKKILLVLCFMIVSSSAFAAYKMNPYTKKLDYYETGGGDFTSSTLSLPNSDTLPATCTPGQIYFDNNADSLGTLYVCRSTPVNTWMAFPRYSGYLGAPSADTASATDNDTSVATTAFTRSATQGTFTGTTIADNSTTVQALQALETAVEGKLATNGSAANLTSFPTLNQNTTGTAAGLSGTPNITVGTISAGATGFSVDADGDVTAKSFTASKVSGAAGVSTRYEANSTDTDYVGEIGPASMTANTSYILRDPSAKTTSANMVKACTTAGETGTGTPADPFIQVCAWVDLDNYAPLADPVFTGSVQLPNGANPTTDAAGEVAVDTSTGAGQGLRVNAAIAFTLPAYQTKCTTISAAAATSDFPVERFPYAVTIRAIHVYQSGATNVIGGLDECTGTGGICTSVTAVDADITGTADTWVDDDGSLTNAGIAAGNGIFWHTTSVSGTNTYTMVCFDYTVDQVN